MDTKNNTVTINDTVTLIHTYRKAGATLEREDPANASICYGRALQLFSQVGLRAATGLLPEIRLENVLSGIFDVCLAQSRVLWLLHGKQHCAQIMHVLQEAENLLSYSGRQEELASRFAEFGMALQKESNHTSAIEYLNKALTILDMDPSKSKTDSDTWMLHLAISYMSVDPEKAASCLNLVQTDPRSLLMQVKLHTMNEDSRQAQDSFQKLCSDESTTFEMAAQAPLSAHMQCNEWWWLLWVL